MLGEGLPRVLHQIVGSDEVNLMVTSDGPQRQRQRQKDFATDDPAFGHSSVPHLIDWTNRDGLGEDTRDAIMRAVVGSINCRARQEFGIFARHASAARGTERGDLSSLAAVSAIMEAVTNRATADNTKAMILSNTTASEQKPTGC